MKFVIAGIGSIGRRHFQNLLKLGFRDVAVVRRSPRADKPQKEFLAKFTPKVFYDLDAALRTKPDAVFITNPTSLHVRTALQALRSGAHLFIEKPISHTRSGVGDLLKEARRRKRIIYVGYHFRHHPQLKFIKKCIASGALGKILSARFVTGEYLPGWHPWENYRRSYSARKDLGGGVVLTQSHDLDSALWFFGRPRSLLADVRRTGILGIDADDSADMIFKFEKCPAVLVHLDYHESPPLKHCIVTGTKGRVEWYYHEGVMKVFGPGRRTKIFKLPRSFDRNDMYVSELKDFIRCIKNGSPPATDGRAGAMVLTMAIRAKEASRLGQRVKF